MKKLLIVTCLIVGAAGGLLLLAPLFINEETVRQSISRQLSSLSGSEVSLGGSLDYVVYPDLGFSAQNVAIGGTSEPVTIAAKRIVAGANLFSLLSGRVKVTNVVLDSPIISLNPAIDGPQDEQSTSAEQPEDIFQLAAGYLEGLSLDRLEIIDGTLQQTSPAGSEKLASAVNMVLAIPDLDEPMSMAFDGIVGERKTVFEGSLGSLGNLLRREATPVEFNSMMEPAPHPLLADVAGTGDIRFASDGTYQIRNGSITLDGQPVNMDLVYTPGTRPHVWTRIAAGDLVFEQQPSPAPSNSSANTAGNGNQSGNFEIARTIDLDLELQANSIQTGDAIAKGVTAAVSLKDGNLTGSASSSAIAEGQIRSEFAISFSGNTPEFWAQLVSSSIDLGRLSDLAAVSLPINGKLSSDMQFAFRGTGPEIVSETFNMAGTLDLAAGAATVPELAKSFGSGSETITGISATASVTSIHDPVRLVGDLNWRREPVRFDATVPLRKLLLGQDANSRLQLQGARVDGTFSGNLNKSGAVAGQLELDIPSLPRFMGWLGMDSATGVNRLRYSGNVSASGNNFAASKARLTLDDATITGSGSVKTGSKTIINANLASDRLNLNNLIGSGQSGAASSGPSKVDLSFIKGLEGQIRFDANQVRYGNLYAGPLKTTTVFKDSTANVQIPASGFYGGQMQAAFVANAKSATPSISAKINLQNLDTLAFTKAASGFDRIEGRFNSAIDVVASGGNTDIMTRSLAGRADVRLTDGAIRGIDMAKLLRNVQTVLVSGYSGSANERTEFTEFAASFDIQQGVARSQDLRLLGPLLRMNGSGDIDIGNQTIDMRLNPRVVASLSGQGSEFDVSGVEVPLIVRGPLAGPKVYPDLTALLRDPSSALKALSNLKGGLGEIAKDALDPKALLNKQLEKVTGSDNSDLIGGVLQNLASGQANNSTNTPPTNSKELLGSLLQGALGNNGNQPTTTNQPVQSTQPVVQSTQSGVPIPIPNPRKQPGNISQPVPASQSDQIREAVTEKVIEKVLPDNIDQNTGDLLRGILGNIGN